jgi:hypothetical protein
MPPPPIGTGLTIYIRYKLELYVVVPMGQNDVYVVFDANPSDLLVTGAAEAYVAVRVPRDRASDMDFLRRRLANDGRHSRAEFVDRAKEHDVGKVLEVAAVRELVDRTRLLRTASTGRTLSRMRA